MAPLQDHLLDPVTRWWFLAASAIVLIDATFVIFRPGTQRTNSLPYCLWDTYSTFDRRYADLSDAFVVLQSYLNLFEIVLQLVAVALSSATTFPPGSKIGRRSALGAWPQKIAITVSLMTFYKTVIYLLMEEFEHNKYTNHLSLREQVVMVVIPSAFWLLVPLYVIYKNFSVLVSKSAAAAHEAAGFGNYGFLSAANLSAANAAAAKTAPIFKKNLDATFNDSVFLNQTVMTSTPTNPSASPSRASPPPAPKTAKKTRSQSPRKRK